MVETEGRPYTDVEAGTLGDRDQFSELHLPFSLGQHQHSRAPVSKDTGWRRLFQGRFQASSRNLDFLSLSHRFKVLLLVSITHSVVKT